MPEAGSICEFFFFAIMSSPANSFDTESEPGGAVRPRWHDLPAEAGTSDETSALQQAEAGASDEASALQQDADARRRSRRRGSADRRVECPKCSSPISDQVDAWFQHSSRFEECLPSILARLPEAGRAELLERRQRAGLSRSYGHGRVRAEEVGPGERCPLCHDAPVRQLGRHYMEKHAVTKKAGLELLELAKTQAESWARAAGRGGR